MNQWMNEWMNENEYEYDTNMDMIISNDDCYQYFNIEMNIRQSSGDTNNQEHAAYTVYCFF